MSETLRQPAYLTEYSINDFFTINAYENMESAGYALYFLKKIECDERFCSGEPLNQRDILGIMNIKCNDTGRVQ